MGTYVCWRLWAGFKLDDVDFREMSDDACCLVDQISEEPLLINGLKVEHIALPEDSRGAIGVVVDELDWNEGVCRFDVAKAAQGDQVLGQLQTTLRELGIVIKADMMLMHHIDLGG